MHYIYVIQNKINLKLYIGQTTRIKTRWYEHRTTSNKQSKYPLYKSMKKYGLDNFDFTIIEEYDNQIDADEAEDFFINYFNTRNKEFGYNLKPGGGCGSGWHHSNEAKLKLKKAMKSDKNLQVFKDTGFKIVEWNKIHGAPKPNLGKKFSDEHRKKLSESHKGKDNHQSGRTHSEESKAKMRFAKKKI